MLLIALTVLHCFGMCVYCGLGVLDLLSILIKAGQHLLSGAPMNTCIVWKVLLREIPCLRFCMLLVHSH